MSLLIFTFLCNATSTTDILTRENLSFSIRIIIIQKWWTNLLFLVLWTIFPFIRNDDSPITSQVNDIFQHEPDPRLQVLVFSQRSHTFKVLVHQLFALVRVQDAAAGPHDLAETFEVLRGVVALSRLQQLLYAPVQYALWKDLQLAQFSDELDVAQHLPFGQLPPLLFLGIAAAADMLFEGPGAVLKLDLEIIKICD